MLSYQPSRRLNVWCCTRTSCNWWSTSRELLAYPWWPCASASKGNPRRATRSRMIELTVRIASAATDPPCACICGQVLRACQPVLLPLKHLAHRPSSYSKHCDEEDASGQCLSGFLGLRVASSDGSGVHMGSVLRRGSLWVGQVWVLNKTKFTVGP